MNRIIKGFIELELIKWIAIGLAIAGTVAVVVHVWMGFTDGLREEGRAEIRAEWNAATVAQEKKDAEKKATADRTIDKAIGDAAAARTDADKERREKLAAVNDRNRAVHALADARRMLGATDAAVSGQAGKGETVGAGDHAGTQRPDLSGRPDTCESALAETRETLRATLAASVVNNSELRLAKKLRNACVAAYGAVEIQFGEIP